MVLVLVIVCVLLFVLFVVSVGYCSCFWVVWSGLVLIVGVMVPVNSVVFVISLSMFGLIDCYVLGCLVLWFWWVTVLCCELCFYFGLCL